MVVVHGRGERREIGRMGEEGGERERGIEEEGRRKAGGGRRKEGEGEKERERPGKMVQSFKVTAPRSDNLRSVWDLYGRRRKPIPSGCPLTSTCYGNALLLQINTFNF